jgi:hypothetical protein
LRLWAPSVLLGLAVVIPVRGVLFYATDDPDYNTTPPTGTLAGSGWQYLGEWSSYLGTVIASNYILTAQHMGGLVGQPFVYQGRAYASTAFYDDPDSDLRIVRICGVFPTFAPLYAGSAETGKATLVFGRGTQRGSPVTSGLNPSKTNGWNWGPGDNRLRWGENTVAAVVDGSALFEPGVGDLLRLTFDADGGSNECHLSLGDSAGPIFVQDGASWSLAGINYAVDGPYNTNAVGEGFQAALFDEGGLYLQSGGAWQLVPDRPFNQAGGFYATRISPHVAWINSMLQQPDPGTDPPTLESASSVDATYATDPGGTVDSAAMTVTVPRPADARFYRLRACRALQITRVEVLADALKLHYQ